LERHPSAIHLGTGHFTRVDLDYFRTRFVSVSYFRSIGQRQQPARKAQPGTLRVLFSPQPGSTDGILASRHAAKA
jgi:hypothetical protein